MVNLENEMGILESLITWKTVLKSNANVIFYEVGTIKTSQLHETEFFEFFEFNILKANVQEYSSYSIYKTGNDIEIKEFDNDKKLLNSYNFYNSTKSKINELPFELTIIDNKNKESSREFKIEFFPVNYITDFFKKICKISPSGSESDQMVLTLNHPNKFVAQDYINTLINEFDKDGVLDRQQEYKRTMEFVDSRSSF